MVWPGADRDVPSGDGWKGCWTLVLMILGSKSRGRMSAGVVFLDADQRRCELFWSRHPWIKLSGATHTHRGERGGGEGGGWIWSSGSTLKVRSARKVFVALFGLADPANKA